MNTLIAPWFCKRIPLVAKWFENQTHKKQLHFTIWVAKLFVTIFILCNKFFIINITKIITFRDSQKATSISVLHGAVAAFSSIFAIMQGEMESEEVFSYSQLMEQQYFITAGYFIADTIQVKYWRIRQNSSEEKTHLLLTRLDKTSKECQLNWQFEII